MKKKKKKRPLAEKVRSSARQAQEGPAEGGFSNPVLRLLFDAPTPPKYCGAGVCLLGLLYLVGIIHWVLFLEIDAPFYISHDWWVDYNYYSTLGNAVKFGLIPFHSSNLVHTTTRFLAIPETMSFLSPQVILTRISQIRFTNQGYEHTIKPHEQRVL